MTKAEVLKKIIDEEKSNKTKILQKIGDKVFNNKTAPSLPRWTEELTEWLTAP